MRTKEEIVILIAKFDRDMKIYSRGYRLILAIDNFFNVLIFNGSMDETISSHLGRTGKHKWLCCILNKLEYNHCKKSLGE